jgi:hypothetical protein
MIYAYFFVTTGGGLVKRLQFWNQEKKMKESLSKNTSDYIDVQL